MAATPKKGGSAGGSAFTKKRSTLALAATAVLIASVCGAIAAAFVFFGETGDNASDAATVAAGTGRQYDSTAAGTTESATLGEEKASACEIQRCKAGGSEVCGTDGKTYLNECFFHNAQCKNATLDSVKDWKGYNCPNTCKKKIACSEVGKFLCANDGNVYFGYCNLYVAQCLDESIKEVECDKYIFEGVFGK